MRRRYRLLPEPCVTCNARRQQHGASPFCASCLREHVRAYAWGFFSQEEKRRLEAKR